MARKYMLVYQAGIANVFEVDHFGLTSAERGRTRRIMQHAFEPCAWFAKGLREAGGEVATVACNRAGDIAESEWSENLDEQPFSDKFIIVA
jgi:hypothetical protein